MMEASKKDRKKNKRKKEEPSAQAMSCNHARYRASDISPLSWNWFKTLGKRAPKGASSVIIVTFDEPSV